MNIAELVVTCVTIHTTGKVAVAMVNASAPRIRSRHDEDYENVREIERYR